MENGQLKNKISNFISDSQDIQENKPVIQVKEKVVPLLSVPPSPIVPNIKMNGRLSLKSPIMSTPPIFNRGEPSHIEPFRGYNGAFYGAHEAPQTPTSAMWNPPSRPSINGLPPYAPPSQHPSQHTPSRHHYPQQGTAQYYQPPPPPQEYLPPSSPRPYYRQRSNQGGYAPY